MFETWLKFIQNSANICTMKFGFNNFFYRATTFPAFFGTGITISVVETHLVEMLSAASSLSSLFMTAAFTLIHCLSYFKQNLSLGLWISPPNGRY